MSDLISTLRNQAMVDNEDYFNEDYRTKAADLIWQQQARIDELAATVERLKCASMQMLSIDEVDDKEDAATIHSNLNDVLITTPKTNLNHVKREAIIDAINEHKSNLLTFDFDTAIRVNDLIRYANTRYPNDEEQDDE